MPALEFAVAGLADLATVLELISADSTARPGSSPLTAAAEAAFEAILADPNNEIVVARQSGAIVGCAQLTYRPGLSRNGMTRAQIEALRVRRELRGRGIGRKLVAWSVERAKGRGCGLVQLMSNKARKDAHRFYGHLEFAATHDGFKLWLP